MIEGVGAVVPVARGIAGVSAKGQLMREVIVDHPLVPTQLKPIPIKAEPAEEAALFIRRGSRVEGHPAVAGKVNFYPRVGVTAADDVVAADVVVFARQKSGGVARGNADGAKHDGHRRGEILAMSSAASEKEICERIFTRGSEIQRIGVVRNQVALNIGGFVVVVRRARGDVLGKFLDPGIDLAAIGGTCRGFLPDSPAKPCADRQA